MKYLYSIFLSILLCSSSTGKAQEAYAKFSLDRKEIKIGEQIEARLEVAFPLTSEYLFPDLKDTLCKGVEVVEMGKIDTNFIGNNLSTKVYSRSFLITSFDTGHFIIPPIAFVGKDGNLQTEVLLISVSDVEVEMPTQTAQGEPEIEIKDIKTVREKPFSVWEWIKENLLWIVLVVLLGAGIFVYIKYIHPKLKKKHIQFIPEKKSIPPHVLAKEKLNDLERQKLWQSGKVKAFHSNLSEIIREYIELRFNLPALESTTIEISKSMDQISVQTDVKAELNELLELSDLVKFAKYNPIPAENDKNLAIAHRFVDITKAKDEEASNEKPSEIVNEHV